MSSTPTLERGLVAPADEWVDVIPPRRESHYNGANIVVAISRIRSAVLTGQDEGIVIDTDQIRPLDELDADIAAYVSERWDD